MIRFQIFQFIKHEMLHQADLMDKARTESPGILDTSKNMTQLSSILVVIG